GGINVWYLARLEDALIGLVGQALENLGPATISLTEADCQIGLNRRLLDGDRVLHQPNPDGVYDRHTPILRIRRRRTPSEIILVSHACHPTSTGAYDRWSPDWPGAMRRRISTRLDGTRVLFAKGCGADANVVHRDPDSGSYVFSRSPGRARAAGVKLADQVLRALQRGSACELAPEMSLSRASGGLTLKRGPSRKQIRHLALVGDNQSHLTWWARQSLSFPDTRKTVDYEVLVWRLGGLKMFWLEGEVCADLGIALRKMTDGPTATIAYANACPGYISSARLIREGGYEGDTSHKAYFLPAPFAEKSEGEFLRICAKALKGL
ncbi:hypothetical protein MK139_02545, partial [bacterium]|nr:hypothetical protein [bacterium]